METILSVVNDTKAFLIAMAIGLCWGIVVYICYRFLGGDDDD